MRCSRPARCGRLALQTLDAGQLSSALEVARKGGLPARQVLQPEYNLYHRSAFEGALRDLCVSRDIGVVTYYSPGFRLPER